MEHRSSATRGASEGVPIFYLSVTKVGQRSAEIRGLSGQLLLTGQSTFLHQTYPNTHWRYVIKRGPFLQTGALLVTNLCDGILVTERLESLCGQCQPQGMFQ